MVTVCDLKIKAKAMGLKGYSKLRKAELMKLVEGDNEEEEMPKKKKNKKTKPEAKPEAKPEKKKTTKATPENLNALSKKSKKKEAPKEEAKKEEPPKGNKKTTKATPENLMKIAENRKKKDPDDLKFSPELSVNGTFFMSRSVLESSTSKNLFFSIITENKDNFKTTTIKTSLRNQIMKADAEEMRDLIEKYFNPDSGIKIDNFAKEGFILQGGYRIKK